MKITNLIILPVLNKMPKFLENFLINTGEHKFTEKMNEIQYEQKQNIIRESEKFQVEYQKKDHDFTKKLDFEKKKMDIYLELHEKVTIVVNYYNNLYNVKSSEYEVLNSSLKDLKDFINMNRVYINNKNIREKAYGIEEGISGILFKAWQNDDINFKNNYGNEINKVSKLFLEFEQQIEKNLND